MSERRPEDGLSDFDRWRDPTIPWPYEESPHRAGVCPMCNGRGAVLERLDDDRFPVSVPCDHCRRWCAECKKYVLKKGHMHGA